MMGVPRWKRPLLIGSAVALVVTAVTAGMLVQHARASGSDPCSTNAGALLPHPPITKGTLYGQVTMCGEPQAPGKSSGTSASVSPQIVDYCSNLINGTKTSSTQANAQGYVNCNQSVIFIWQTVRGQHCTSWSIFYGCVQWTDVWTAPNQPCYDDSFGVYQAWCPPGGTFYYWNNIPKGWLIRLSNEGKVEFADALIAHSFAYSGEQQY